MSDDWATSKLEPLIDKHSLCDVLVGLELVCLEKAEHIRTNWQDEALARKWDQAARAVVGAAKKVSV